MYVPWHNSGTCGHGQELNFNTPHPPDSRHVFVHQEMVGLIIKPPLTNNKTCTRIFAFLDHVDEILLLLMPELVKFLNTVNVLLYVGRLY